MTRTFLIVACAHAFACGGPAQGGQAKSVSAVEQRSSRDHERAGQTAPTEANHTLRESSATKPTFTHFDRIFHQLRDGISNEELFAPAMTIHTVSASSATDVQEDHEQALGWDLVIAMIERLQHSFRPACRQEEPPSDCKWHFGIDYLGKPMCDATCCESSDPQRPGIPHLKRVCFDKHLRANALEVRTAR